MHEKNNDESCQKLQIFKMKDDENNFANLKKDENVVEGKGKGPRIIGAQHMMVILEDESADAEMIFEKVDVEFDAKIRKSNNDEE